MIHIPEYWFGTPQGLWRLFDANATYRESPINFPPRGLFAGEDEEDDEIPSLIQVKDGVGILSIKGPLVANESWLDQYFGITSYPAIHRALGELVELHEAGEIHSAVHVFSTPGGDAEGINGLTESMQAAKAAIPDTTSYTASSALSAGYWLATINDALRVDAMGEVGSVGVVSVAKTMHRMLKENGIDVEVIRSGKYKALLSPYEPLSEAGLKDVEEKGRQLHGFFIDHILANRPQLANVSRDQWAEGKTFFGQQAVEMGLADGPVITLNTLVNGLISKYASESPTYSFGHNTRGTIQMAKKIVVDSPEEQAKLAAGVDLSQIKHTVVEEDDPPAETTPPDPAELDIKAQAQAETPDEPGSDEGALVTFLRGELTSVREQLSAKDLELAKLKEQAQSETLLGPIAIEAIHRLQVGLRQTPTVLAGLPAATLAAQYRETKAQFEQQYPVGRQALSEDDETRKPVDLGEQRLALVK